MDWFCVPCHDDFTNNQKYCLTYHKGIWSIPTKNVADKH
ncbi:MULTISPECIES: putative zinc ribbon protein [Providencia]